MKYRVDDELSVFEFHDSVFSFVSFHQNELIFSAEHLNIHKGTPQNQHDCDMQIESAKISFQQVEFVSLEPWRAYRQDDNGKWYTNEPKIIYEEKEAETHFLNQAKNELTILDAEINKKKNKHHIEFSISVEGDGFALVFAFSKASVEWDEYCKKAWYELHKQYIHKGYLITPAGEEETEIRIVYHAEDTYYQGKLEKGPTVSVGVKYNGEQLWGQGKDYLWEDAFADLQKQLPDGVFLKCCMTCQHGNMCPFGNNPGQLFCTKGIVIHSKEELCDLFINHEESKIFDQMKSVVDHCNSYRPQNNDDFTYSDYLYYLHK